MQKAVLKYQGRLVLLGQVIEGEIRYRDITYLDNGQTGPVSEASLGITRGASVVQRFTYGEALELLRLGYRVAREGWNGKNMWLGIIDHWTFTNGKWDNIECVPFIAMRTADRKIVPWLCSQTDALARDYVVVYDVGGPL